MRDGTRYIAALITDSSCVPGNTFQIVVAEADEKVTGDNPDTGEEITEPIMSDREVADIDTGIVFDDDIHADPSTVRDLLDDAGWRITGDAEVADNAYYYEVEPHAPALVNAPELEDAHVREAVAALNAHADAHDAHDARVCGCNPFEDVVYGLDAYDDAKTARFPQHRNAFVLTDGTEVTADADRGRWIATRYRLTSESLRTGDPGARTPTWTMDTGGHAFTRGPSGTWQQVEVFYTHRVEASTDGRTWDIEPGALLEAEASDGTAADYAREVLDALLDDAAPDGTGPRRRDGMHYRVHVWPGRSLAATARPASAPAATAVWSPPRRYTLYVVSDAQPGVPGADLGAPGSPVAYDDLDDATRAWLDEHGLDADPDVWVLVVDADEPAEPTAVIASRTIAVPR